MPGHLHGLVVVVTVPTSETMTQQAPYPVALAQLVHNLRYKPGWSFRLDPVDRGQGSSGLTLVITARVPDTNDPRRMTRIAHYMIVPAASFNRRSWQRWLFSQILLVEQHEAAEFFAIGSSRPYSPLHGPGNDPYLVAELASDTDRRTSFTGDVSEASP
jgi:hypothetical protein